MSKLLSNETGFGVIETALILVIIGMVGFVGWYVLNAQKNTDKNLSVTNTTAVSPKKKVTKTTASVATTAPVNQAVAPSATLASFTTKNHAITFKYPANWKLNDQSIGGDDLVSVTSPNSFAFTLSAGSTGHPSSDSTSTVLYTQPVTNASLKNANMDYVGTGSTVRNFTISQSTTDAYTGFDFGGAFNVFIHGQSSKPELLPAAKADVDYKAAQKVASSVTFGA